MGTLSDLAVEVSKLINDSDDCNSEYNFTRWSKQELIHYAQDAINMIFMLYPKKFTKTTKVPLVAGIVQTLPEDCVLMTKLLGITDASGAISSIVSNGDDRLAALFTNGCSQPITSGSYKYKIESYSYEETSDNIFYVKPPVPASALPLEVTVICSSAPDSADKDYVPESWMHNLIIEWMQYRAYSTEDESQSSDANAKMHLEHFYSIIGNYKTAEKMLKADMQRGAANATAQSQS